MAFSAETLDFLFENRLHDNRDWFKAHKAEYETLVQKPMRAFAEQMTARLQKLDSELELQRVARIYRDTRFAKDSIFRENIWCTVGRSHDLYESLPSFYFDISPAGFEYGCGHYHTATPVMAAARKLILAKDPAAMEAMEAYRKQRTFKLYGDLYKRDHYPAESAENRDWLNRKTLGVSAQLHDFELLFSDALADRVFAQLKKIFPVYTFMLKANHIAGD